MANAPSNRTNCPDEVLKAIYGTTETKKEDYDQSLGRYTDLLIILTLDQGT